MKRRILVKTTPFHALFKKKKKKTQNGAGTIVFFPTHAENRGEDDFFFSTFCLHSFPSFAQKDAETRTPLAQRFPRVGRTLEGRQHSGRPSHVSPVFSPIKTGEEEEKREEGKNRREDERGRRPREGRGEKRRSREENEKNTEERERRKTAGHSASATITIEPTPPAAPPRRHRR